MLITNYNTAKIFVWDNRFSKGNYTNAGGSEVTLAKGTVLGRISATGLLVPFTSAATNGSEDPLGILADDYTVAAGATASLTFCDGGDIAEELVLLQGTDTLDTVVTDKGRVRDLIARNTHCKLVPGTELTGTDNQ